MLPLLAQGAYWLGNAIRDFCEGCLVISHFSPLCLWTGAREKTEDVSVLLPFWQPILPLLLPSFHLISTSQFLNGYKGQVNRVKNLKQRCLETDFLPPFSGGWAHQADMWHSIFLCAHINDSTAYWNYRVGSSGKIAEEFWESGQMLDGRSLRQAELRWKHPHFFLVKFWLFQDFLFFCPTNKACKRVSNYEYLIQ